MNGELDVVERPEPVPDRGQVRIEVLRCGICGSDLHARHGADTWADLAARLGYDRFARSTQSIVFGHEFCGEVVEHGPKCRRASPTGTHVVALPLLRSDRGVDTLGLSVHAPGAYAEQLLVQESLMMPVPNGLPPEIAALTEPMAVGWHAVENARLTPQDLPLVIGCGPVGLAVIAGLKVKGVHPIIAADFSPARRALALRMGADIVVDPAKESPYKSWTDAATPAGYDPSRFAQLFGTSPKQRPGVIFECVGVPGMIQRVLEGAPTGARVVVVGVCMETDQFEPFFGIVKQLNLQFVLAYTADEFATSLRLIADGKIDVTPLITGKVGLAGVQDAFDDLANPEKHAKILVDPWM